MAWHCHRDGACCTQPSAVVMTEQEFDLIRQDPIGRREALTIARKEGFVAIAARPCPFFEATSKRCRIYAVRPLNCRRFACFRDDPDTEPFENAAIPIAALKDPAKRRQAEQLQRRTMRTWGLAHGWRP